jgi:hypothetical protein
MKFLLLILVFFLALEPELELCKAQSLKNLSIFKSFNLSNYGIRSALRSMPSAPLHITGTGTSSDPYVLYDAQDVDSIRYFSSTAYFELGNDIDLSSLTSFTPIYPGTYWRGSLNGKGHKLSNLTITTPPALSAGKFYSGMFWGLGGNVVSNTYTLYDITFENFIINLKYDIASGYEYAFGAIAGEFGYTQMWYSVDKVSITNVNIHIEDTTTGSLSTFCVGGFVGIGSQARLKNISVSGSVYGRVPSTPTNNDRSGVGGLIGYSNAVITQCYSTARIQASNQLSDGSVVCGGIGGYVWGGSLTNVYYKSLSGGSHSQNFQGGIVGLIKGASITNAYAVIDSMDTQDRTSVNVAGLIAGYAYTSANFIRCHADSQYTINRPSYYTLGLVGGYQAGYSGSIPTPHTTSEMKLQSTFTSWDFTNTWVIDSTKNNGYPYILSSP